jgi:hypothetical protein
MTKERISLHLSAARNWAHAVSPAVEEILRMALEKEKLIRVELINKYGSIDGRRLFEINEDIYSNPFCDSLADLPPNKLLEVDPVVCKVIVSNYRYSYRKVPFHLCFRLGETLIDPTFGQFVDINLAIKEYPASFVGKIMVGTIEEAGRKFGVSYLV